MTIVELLIVVGIIVILTGATLPAFVGFAERRDFINKVDEFVNEVRLVRNKALAGVSQNGVSVQWGLRPDCGEAEYELGYRVPPDGSFIPQRTIEMPSNVGFAEGSALCDTILFDRLTGFPQGGNPVTIRLLHMRGDDQINARDVVINSSGQVIVLEVTDE